MKAKGGEKADNALRYKIGGFDLCPVLLHLPTESVKPATYPFNESSLIKITQHFA